MSDSDVLFEVQKGKTNQFGVITLNRPQALNALTHEMILSLTEKLRAWEQEKSINAVIIQSSSTRAFCAGGDIKSIYQKKGQDLTLLNQFFFDEYRLNRIIHHYKKPYIALLDGITMGGGVGISLHGSYRIATENFLFAMPETGIGFFPDIGGSYLLSHLAHHFGYYLGLSGVRLKSDDAYHGGLLDYCISIEAKDSILKTLLEFDSPILPSAHDVQLDNVFKGLHLEPESGPVFEKRQMIETAFSHPTVENILQALKEHDSPWAGETIEILNSKSPTSLKVTLTAIMNATKMNFDDAIKMEFVMVNQFLKANDFYEGVRALLIDKDNTPNWQPSMLSDIDEASLQGYFKNVNLNPLIFFA